MIKKSISVVLIIATIVTSSGFTTFAMSISNSVNRSLIESSENEKEKVSKYYYEYLEESKVLLLNNSSDDELLDIEETYNTGNNSEDTVSSSYSDVDENELEPEDVLYNEKLENDFVDNNNLLGENDFIDMSSANTNNI